MTMHSTPSCLFVATVLLLSKVAIAFQVSSNNDAGSLRMTREKHISRSLLSMLESEAKERSGGGVEEYKNAPTKILSNFMGSSADTASSINPIDLIDFDAKKFQKVDLDTLAGILDYELYNKEWFVTGNVNPIYFSETFEFQDPDVKLSGIEDYARGVYKLFNQETARAEIISTVRNNTTPNTITCTWRLSGKVNIGPGLSIKPYICYTDFTVDANDGLIIMQEDRFSIPGADILLSATLGQVFPFLIGTLLAAPAPPVEPRELTMPKVTNVVSNENPIVKWIQSFGIQ
jgi:hypothetical protein